MIPFTITQPLKHVLAMHDIEPKDYKPAYQGESVGLDLYSCGEYTINNKQNKSVLISTGLKIALPLNHVGLLFQRGSVWKTILDHRAGVIDPGFTGEIFVASHLISSDKELHRIVYGEKLPFQLLVMPVITDYKYIEDVEYDVLTASSKRNTNMLGSTN